MEKLEALEHFGRGGKRESKKEGGVEEGVVKVTRIWAADSCGTREVHSVYTVPERATRGASSLFGAQSAQCVQEAATHQATT